MDGDFSDVPNSDVSNQRSDDQLVRDLKKSLIFDNFDSKKRNIYYYDVDEDGEDGDVTEALLVQMGYGKTETKKGPVMTPAPGHEEVEEEEEEGDVIISKEALNQIQMGRPPKHEPPATPVPADNLKSAMKGSGREEKSPGKERKVTWAEGVFDQIRVETETHSHKWGKDKNKSGGKDKERKGGAKGKKKFRDSSSKKCIDTLDQEDGTWSLFW